MNPSLVMSEEDRKLLMSRRLEKKRQQLQEHHRLKQLSLHASQGQNENESNKEGKTTSSGEPSEDMEVKWDSKTDSDGRSSPPSAPVKDEVKEEQIEDELDVAEIGPIVMDQVKIEQDHCERMDECKLPREDLERITMLQKLLRRGLIFPEFPQHYYEEDADVMEHIFFVFCKGMGNFFSLIPDFRELQTQDRNMLLKDAVSKAIFIFGAHQFQQDYECWPRKLLSPSCTFPKVTMATVKKFLGDEDILFKLKGFMYRFRPFFEDEVLTLLSLMVAVFDQEGSSIPVSADVAERRDKYLSLLKDYVQQRDATVPLALIMSELRTCFQEVQKLVQCLKNTSNKEEVAPSRTSDERAFASSLHDLGGDSRLPPKKAFHKKASKGNGLDSPDVIFLEEVETTYTWEDTRSASGTPVGNHVAYQDHDYQRPSAYTSVTPLARRQTQEALPILRTKELDIIPLPAGIQLQYRSLRGEAPYTSTNSCRDIPPIIGHKSWSLREHVVDGMAFPLSKDVDLIRHPRDFTRKLQTPSHHPNPSSRKVNSVSRSQNTLPRDTYSFQPHSRIPQDLHSPPTCRSPGSSQEYLLQPKFLQRERDPLHQPDLASDTSYQYQNYQPAGYHETQSFRLRAHPYQEEPRPSSTSSSASFSSSSSTESPMTHACQGLNVMPANEDEQILQAIQGVLPPRLVTHLATKLASARRTRQDDL